MKAKRDARIFYARRINALDIGLQFSRYARTQIASCLNSYALDALAQMLSVYYLSPEGISQ